MRILLHWVQAALALAVILPICGPILNGRYVAWLPYHDHIVVGPADGAHTHDEPGYERDRDVDPLSAGGVISVPATGDSRPNQLPAGHMLLNAPPGTMLPGPAIVARSLAPRPLLAIELFFPSPPDKPPRA